MTAAGRCRSAHVHFDEGTGHDPNASGRRPRLPSADRDRRLGLHGREDRDGRRAPGSAADRNRRQARPAALCGVRRRRKGAVRGQRVDGQRQVLRHESEVHREPALGQDVHQDQLHGADAVRRRGVAGPARRLGRQGRRVQSDGGQEPGVLGPRRPGRRKGLLRLRTHHRYDQKVPRHLERQAERRGVDQGVEAVRDSAGRQGPAVHQERVLLAVRGQRQDRHVLYRRCGVRGGGGGGAADGGGESRDVEVPLHRFTTTIPTSRRTRPPATSGSSGPPS